MAQYTSVILDLMRKALVALQRDRDALPKLDPKRDLYNKTIQLQQEALNYFSVNLAGPSLSKEA